MITHRLPELYDEPDCFKSERWDIIKRSPYDYHLVQANICVLDGTLLYKK